MAESCQGHLQSLPESRPCDWSIRRAQVVYGLISRWHLLAHVEVLYAALVRGVLAVVYRLRGCESRRQIPAESWPQSQGSGLAGPGGLSLSHLGLGMGMGREAS